MILLINIYLFVIVLVFASESLWFVHSCLTDIGRSSTYFLLNILKRSIMFLIRTRIKDVRNSSFSLTLDIAQNVSDERIDMFAQESSRDLMISIVSLFEYNIDVTIFDGDDG
jgi:hypothetical protein